MDALKRAMAWDEEVYGREYDLDVFNIVAVSDFNMGAMENKGLNIFNDKYILASPTTATDTDYAQIESVIAHEYFHNWTGNRITCRDWFQLCLKEGLTVFRDHAFSADMRSVPVRRIGDVRTLRAQQFPEDAGPLAHNVRPDTYFEINNFYTATIYEKGAEIIRMLKVLIGDDAFRKGMDLYFDRYDGTAATIEEFIFCFAETSGRDLAQFSRWYNQAGTPLVEATASYDEAAKTCHARFFPILQANTRPGEEGALCHSNRTRSRRSGPGRHRTAHRRPRWGKRGGTVARGDRALDRAAADCLSRGGEPPGCLPSQGVLGAGPAR